MKDIRDVRVQLHGNIWSDDVHVLIPPKNYQDFRAFFARHFDTWEHIRDEKGNLIMDAETGIFPIGMIHKIKDQLSEAIALIREAQHQTIYDKAKEFIQSIEGEKK